MLEKLTAAAIQYTPMTDIPFLETWNPSSNFSGSPEQVFNALFTFSITIGAMLAVFMFIWGGLQLISARDSSDTVTKGKAKMTNAILGLLMLLSTFIVLSTINPQLTELKFLSKESGLGPLQAPPKTPTVSGLNTGDYCYSTTLGGTRCFSSLNQCKASAGSSSCFDQSKSLKQELDSNENYQDIINEYSRREERVNFCYLGEGPCYSKQSTCLKDTPKASGVRCPLTTTRLNTPIKDARFQLQDSSGNVVNAYKARELCDAYAVSKNASGGGYKCTDIK